MTIKDHIMTLPDGYRELALKYEDGEWQSELDGDIVEALWCFTNYGNTDEKRDFWHSVRQHYSLGTPLPPLPNNKP